MLFCSCETSRYQTSKTLEPVSWLALVITHQILGFTLSIISSHLGSTALRSMFSRTKKKAVQALSFRRTLFRTTRGVVLM